MEPVTLSQEDERNLRELQEEIAGTARSPWEPRCVSRAFQSGLREEPFVLTMQSWIDLEYARSPFLEFKWPDAEHVIGDLKTALAAFQYPKATPEELTPEEAVTLCGRIIDAARDAFSMCLPMRIPGERAATAEDDGFGTWLPVLAALKAQLHFTMAEALRLPVQQAFAIIAAHRRNQGWSVAGETYRDREIGEPDEETSNSER